MLETVELLPNIAYVHVPAAAVSPLEVCWHSVPSASQGPAATVRHSVCPGAESGCRKRRFTCGTAGAGTVRRQLR